MRLSEKNAEVEEIEERETRREDGNNLESTVVTNSFAFESCFLPLPKYLR